jgi:anaerobic magnesium-protoporphyrin IX monomethyl ester cyclase
MVYLAGAARNANVEPAIYDAMAKGDGWPQVEERLAQTPFAYLATGAITATINDTIKILAIGKRLKPQAVTILGGVHPSFMFREVLEGTAAVDYIVIGEGEATLAELLTVLEKGGDPATVAGIAFKRGDEIVVTASRPLIEKLDELTAAWDLVAWPDYLSLVIDGSRLGAISTSRGCDHDCAFCSQHCFWEKSWRARDPQKVAEEVAYLYDTYGVNVLLLTDEYPTRDRDRWEALLDALIAGGRPVHLLMETRGEDVLRDRDLLGKYRQAGVIYLSVGVESASQPQLDALRKGQSVAGLKQVFELLREAEIVSEASFMLGFPDDTPATIKETMQLVQQYAPDIANFLTYTPWPYSEGYQKVKPLLRSGDYARYNMVDPVLEPHHMSLLQVEVAQADCYRRFYMSKVIDFMMMKATFRRDFLMRITKLFMASSYVMKKLKVGMLGMIPAKMEQIRRGKG